MAKYLSTVIHLIKSNRITVHNRIHTLLKSKYKQYSSNPQQCQDNNIHHVNDSIKQKQERLLKVAIIGIPNAGKSSLINSIIKRNVSIHHLTSCLNIKHYLFIIMS